MKASTTVFRSLIFRSLIGSKQLLPLYGKDKDVDQFWGVPVSYHDIAAWLKDSEAASGHYNVQAMVNWCMLQTTGPSFSEFYYIENHDGGELVGIGYVLAATGMEGAPENYVVSCFMVYPEMGDGGLAAIASFNTFNPVSTRDFLENNFLAVVRGDSAAPANGKFRYFAEDTGSDIYPRPYAEVSKHFEDPTGRDVALLIPAPDRDTFSPNMIYSRIKERS